MTRPKDVKALEVAAWYMTKTVHGPVVSVWSTDPMDADVVEAIAFSGIFRKAK